MVSSRRMVLRRYIPTFTPDLSNVAACRSNSGCYVNTRSPHRTVLEGRRSLGRSLDTVHILILLDASGSRVRSEPALPSDSTVGAHGVRAVYSRTRPAAAVA